MTHEAVTYTDDSHEQGTRLKRAIHRVFPSILEGKLNREARQFAEEERRKALGQGGRIIEDAYLSVGICKTRSMWVEKLRQRKVGIVEPLGGESDSYPSFSRTKSRWLAENDLDVDNIVGKMESPRISFAIGLTPELEFSKHKDGSPDVYLVGRSEDESSTGEAVRLNQATLEKLRPTDLDVLELLAADIKHTSRVGVFVNFADQQI